MVQDIIKGYILMGDDSTHRMVLSICKGYDTLYRVGDSYVVNSNHILSLKNNKGDAIDGDIPVN